ncbi:MAG: XdhC family protein [Lachnospiraceae bacterium]|nr:XdhC family protein [Lachnospiraceae bacterium]
MKEMFDYLIEGRELVLVTVVASSGSTPRGAGARMIVTEEGRIWGTIGGGAVEYRAEQIAKQVLSEKNSLGKEFQLVQEDVENLGMICGGGVRVFFQYVSAGCAQSMRLATQAKTLLEKGEAFWLISDLARGGRLGLYNRKMGVVDVEDPEGLPSQLKRQPVRIEEEGRNLYAEQINASGKVYVFGCGHVAQELVPVLAHVGFRCIALDDRPEFADAALFPDAEQVLLIDFHRIADFISIGEEDYVCVMTRGHAYDTIVQAQMLQTPACYIGVIGSRAKKAGVFKKLYEMGFTEVDTDRIISPIGLEIKGETPAEIAISIAGQMILHRAERSQK